MLARYQAQPGCQVAAVLEVGAVADRRYHCGRRLRPDSPDLGNPLANLAGLEDRSDLAIKSFDPFVDLQHECIQARDDLAQQLRKLITGRGQDLWNQPPRSFDCVPPCRSPRRRWYRSSAGARTASRTAGP